MWHKSDKEPCETLSLWATTETQNFSRSVHNPLHCLWRKRAWIQGIIQFLPVRPRGIKETAPTLRVCFCLHTATCTKNVFLEKKKKEAWLLTPIGYLRNWRVLSSMSRDVSTYSLWDYNVRDIVLGIFFCWFSPYQKTDRMVVQW